ncbi:hypothetical protein NDU88_001595 [Pleurodeles waltl]|uniref:Uncharacterized protein n=1 Tax=Pleurodeles waltl TaxID=8319 RepID=A0AAV7P7A1_PLEWA|nr:hypothetical protein NDU88_001595 [Pleurodeles waltl]
MEGEYIQAALSLLKKSGRMDHVRQEALPALRPARKAAQGVAATVMACSPPRSATRVEQVRRQGWGGGRAPAVKPSRVLSKAAGLKKGFLGLPLAGRGGARGGRARAAMGRERRETWQFGGLSTPREARGRAQMTGKAGEVHAGGLEGSGPSLGVVEEVSLPQGTISPIGEGGGP